jgi:DNA repair protein RadC
MERTKQPRVKLVRIGRTFRDELPVLLQPMISPKVGLLFWRQVICREEDHENEKENLCVVMLDTCMRPIGWHRVAIGSLDACTAHSREIFRTAIVMLAFKVVLIHNHPSGNIDPSDSDLRLTANLKKAGRLLGIPLFEHFIVGSPSGEKHTIFSFRDQRLLT